VLNASVHCKQKRLQRLSETVPVNNRIPQAVRQGIPDWRAGHTESPSAIKARVGGAVRPGAVRWRIGDVAAMRHLRHRLYIRRVGIIQVQQCSSIWFILGLAWSHGYSQQLSAVPPNQHREVVATGCKYCLWQYANCFGFHTMSQLQTLLSPRHLLLFEIVYWLFVNFAIRRCRQSLSSVCWWSVGMFSHPLQAATTCKTAQFSVAICVQWRV